MKNACGARHVNTQSEILIHYDVCALFYIACARLVCEIKLSYCLLKRDMCIYLHLCCQTSTQQYRCGCGIEISAYGEDSGLIRTTAIRIYLFSHFCVLEKKAIRIQLEVLSSYFEKPR